MTAAGFQRVYKVSVITASGFYCQNIVLRRTLLSSILSWRGELWVQRTGREKRQAKAAEEHDHSGLLSFGKVCELSESVAM